MIGRILSADAFEPKYAMIVQNKDEIKIPLTMETIPTPKEFRDAIESLSLEQQRFAKAYRSMQLSSTLFGVVVVQIKPQLEKVLKLPPDSLTKEIQLSEDLLELFIKYQIPSDLLTYDGNPAASVEEKVTFVSNCVTEIKSMIASSRSREIEEMKQEYKFAKPQEQPEDQSPDSWSDSDDAEDNFKPIMRGGRGRGRQKKGIVHKIKSAMSPRKRLRMKSESSFEIEKGEREVVSSSKKKSKMDKGKDKEYDKKEEKKR